MDASVGLALAISATGLALSIGGAIWVGGRKQGQTNEKVSANVALVTLCNARLEAHLNDNIIHTSKELRAAQEALVDQRFRFQEQLINEKFSAILNSIAQVGREISAVDKKVDRALTACSSLSEELQKETGALAQRIEGVRARIHSES